MRLCPTPTPSQPPEQSEAGKRGGEGKVVGGALCWKIKTRLHLCETHALCRSPCLSFPPVEGVLTITSTTQGQEGRENEAGTCAGVSWIAVSGGVLASTDRPLMVCLLRAGPWGCGANQGTREALPEICLPAYLPASSLREPRWAVLEDAAPSPPAPRQRPCTPFPNILQSPLGLCFPGDTFRASASLWPPPLLQDVSVFH